jgi:hypothetical protein
MGSQMISALPGAGRMPLRKRPTANWRLDISLRSLRFCIRDFLAFLQVKAGSNNRVNQLVAMMIQVILFHTGKGIIGETIETLD